MCMSIAADQLVASMSGSVVTNGLDIANGVRLEPVISSTKIELVATSVPLTAQPGLHAARNGDALWVCWPLGYAGFTMQSATNLTAPIQWSPVSLTEPNRFVAEPSGPAKFFRLISP